MPRILDTKRLVVELETAHDNVWAYEIARLQHRIKIGIISSGDQFVNVTSFVFFKWLLRVGVIKRLNK